MSVDKSFADTDHGVGNQDLIAGFGRLTSTCDAHVLNLSGITLQERSSFLDCCCITTNHCDKLAISRANITPRNRSINEMDVSLKSSFIYAHGLPWAASSVVNKDGTLLHVM
jgi:hypothetical protein